MFICYTQCYVTCQYLIIFKKKKKLADVSAFIDKSNTL